MSNEIKQILFVCVHNSGRSQMAEAFFNHMANGAAIAHSAGTHPSHYVNSTVAQAMAETGMDVYANHPRLLSQDMLDSADRVITMGCIVEESCPANLVPTEDWGLEDPKSKPLEEVREIREQVRSKVSALIADMGIS